MSKYDSIFRVIERLYSFLLFQSAVGCFIFTCEGHDKAFGNDPLEYTFRSYSCSENQISGSD